MFLEVGVTISAIRTKHVVKLSPSRFRAVNDVYVLQKSVSQYTHSVNTVAKGATASNVRVRFYLRVECPYNNNST